MSSCGLYEHIASSIKSITECKSTFNLLTERAANIMNGGIPRVMGHDEDLVKKVAKSFFTEGSPLWSFASDILENWFV